MSLRSSRARLATALLVLTISTGTASADIVADSSDDWSTNGTQGFRGWWNGYHDFTENGAYSAGDFIAFENSGGTAAELKMLLAVGIASRGMMGLAL